MNSTAAKLFILPLLLLAAVGAPALDFWRHPEIAGKNSVFLDVGLSPLVFADPQIPGAPVELRLDYLPPLPLPVSVGVFMAAPAPNFKSFGARAAYHFDIRLHDTDLYAAYVFDCGFVRNGILEEYNDTPVDIRYYDFRVGVRRFFGTWFGLAAESGFKFESVVFMLSVKIF